MLAAEKRIADLEVELKSSETGRDQVAYNLGATQAALEAAQAELKPLRKLTADIAATVVPVSEVAPTDTIGRNRVVLLVDPSGKLLWMVRQPNGEVIPVFLDPNDPTTVKDLLASGSKSQTLGNFTDGLEAAWKKAQDEYNALVDKYNNALALLKQSNDLLNQEQAFLRQVNASNAAAQAAARQSQISNALLMCSIMQHQTYTPPPIFYNPPVVLPPPLPRAPVNCTSTSYVPGTVSTTCN